MSTKAFLKLLITIISGVFLVSTAIRLYILYHDVQERGWASSVDGALPITLGFVFGFIYLQTLLSVKPEIELARKLFSSARRPTELDFNTNRTLVALQFLGFSGLFIALLFTTDNAFLSSLFMFLIAAVDFWTTYSISRNTATVFSDERYNPDPDEPDYDLVQKRRAVVELFLFERPHLVKEAARLVGCGIALGAATYGYFTHAAPITSISYVVLISTLLINETVAMRWRHDRNRRLAAIASQLLDASDIAENARQRFIAKQLGQSLRNVAVLVAGLILMAIQSSMWEFVEKILARLFGR